MPLSPLSALAHVAAPLATVALAAAAGAGAYAQVPTDYVTRGETLPCVDERFALRVHVAETEDGPAPFDTLAFASMVERLNEFTAPICLGFEVCEYLTVENYRYATVENDELAEQGDLFGDANRIDVYVSASDESVPAICGLATLGGIDDLATGTVLLVGTCVREDGTSLAHEIGHFFGLEHTFNDEPEVELVDGSNCATAGDEICDTPADPFDPEAEELYVSPNDPCRFVSRLTDANGTFYVPHTANVMSYYAEECHCGFTAEQLRVVAEAAAEASGRVW